MLKLRYEWSNFPELRERNEAAGVTQQIIDKAVTAFLLEVNIHMNLYKVSQKISHVTSLKLGMGGKVRKEISKKEMKNPSFYDVTRLIFLRHFVKLHSYT